MASITKRLLSGSTSGKGIKLTGGTNSAAAVEVHTAIAGATDFDEIWLWVTNTSTAGVKLTLEWGTATAVDGNIEVTIPPEEGLMQVAPGLILNGGMIVEAFASTADVLLIFGFVNRIDY